MRTIERAVEQIAPSACPIFLAGAAGTGKHSLALRIYELSARVDGSFLELDCADAPVDALRPGARWLSCGSLYLDEIADLGPENQAALLNLYFSPASDWRKLPRLIVATADASPEGLRGGVFNEALYDSVTPITLRLPTLQQRGRDVLLLAEYFVTSYADLFGRPQPALSDDVVRFFLEYSWPGNLDELEAACKTLVALGDGRAAVAALRSSALHAGGSNNHRRQWSLKHAARTASRHAERELIAEVLQQTGGNRKQAAQQLQISYKALLYKLKQNGVPSPASLPKEEGEEV